MAVSKQTNAGFKVLLAEKREVVLGLSDRQCEYHSQKNCFLSNEKFDKKMIARRVARKRLEGKRRAIKFS